MPKLSFNQARGVKCSWTIVICPHDFGCDDTEWDSRPDEDGHSKGMPPQDLDIAKCASAS